MIKVLTVLLLVSLSFAQIYFPNDVMFDYPEEPTVNYVPMFENYPDVLPDYRMMPYQPQTYSYSRQMWNGCGCSTTKTYSDYMKTRPKSRGQRQFTFFQLM